jgi:hypothetical protein
MIETEDLVAEKVYVTRDYDKFKVDSEFNRVVNMKNVAKIIKSYDIAGDYGKEFPILVDNKYCIIDGQHRYTARVKKKLPIFYIKTVQVTPETLGLVNDAVAKWRPNDFEKAAIKSSLFKFVVSFQKGLDEKIWTRAALMKHLKISKQDLISDNQDKLAFVQKQTIILQPYLKWFETGITNRIMSNSTVTNKDKRGTIFTQTIYSLAVKLANQGVDINELPINYDYLGLLEWLKKKEYKV